jgi:hypothetical protein
MVTVYKDIKVTGHCQKFDEEICINISYCSPAGYYKINKAASHIKAGNNCDYLLENKCDNKMCKIYMDAKSYLSYEEVNN